MENDKETKIIQKLYKEVIQDEISRRDFKLEKKAFIDEHFSREPFWLMRPAVLVPALSLCLVLALVQFAPIKSMLSQTSQTPPVAEAPDFIADAGQRKDALESSRGEQGTLSEESDDKAEVDVRWARSEVGSVMVYQKDVGDVPITVVWVFTPTDAPGL